MSALGNEPPELLAAELTAVEAVIRSGRWVLGPEVQRFEREWAGAVGAEEAVGVGNGTDALELGLAAIGIGAGDEVITTGMTSFATVIAIRRTGASPVLADIDPATAQLHPESVRRCISPATRAVVHVHLYGRAGPVDRLAALCRETGIDLVEDCAQAHGAQLGHRAVGTFGRFAAWSFYPTKNLGAVGDAGALTTAEPELATRVRMARDYGRSDRDDYEFVGRNSRLDELQAALLRVRLDRLDGWTEARRRVATAYEREITHRDVEILPPPADRLEHVHHLFVVRCPQRDLLRDHLVSKGIECLAHYPKAAHRQQATPGLRLDPAGVATTDRHARTCLSIPCHHGLTDHEIERVIVAVNSFRTPATG